MCGITGYVTKNTHENAYSIVKKMSDSIAHRGPDGDGFWHSDRVAFGHRRLAVIDLTENSSQPMQSDNDRYVMVFNGEIYNYLDIRKDLVSEGWTFKTAGDTEVLLKAFEAYGTDAFIKLNGMFACAIFDKKEKILTLARDRFGVKPLYYMVQNGVVAFASEAKAFLAHPDLNMSLNPDGLAEYLTFMNFISDATLFKDTYLLPAGSFSQFSIDHLPADGLRLKSTKYWDFEFVGDDLDFDSDSIADEIHDKFTRAVRRQLVSDVGFSSFLSGGVDSGSIAAVAANEPGKLRTFTAFFDYEHATQAEISFDERAAAQLMARTFGTEHHEILIGAEDFQNSLIPLCKVLDEPRVGQSYPNYLVSGLVRKFETVTLSGAGGDELFGGYPWRYYQGLPANDFGTYADGYYDYWRRLAATDQEFDALTRPIRAEVSNFDGRSVFESIYPASAKQSSRPEEFLNWALYFEAKTFLNGLLIVEDKVAMAHGLETRVPFLDNDLVDLACKVPIQAKLDGIAEQIRRQIQRKNGEVLNETGRRTDGKHILRHMMGRLVPEEIYNREKQGFSAPDGSWFKNQSYEFITDKLLNTKRRLHDFVDINEIRDVVEGHKLGTRNDGRHKIWAFLHLAETMDNFSL